MIAGFPDGIQPPSTDGPYYNVTQMVTLRIPVSSSQYESFAPTAILRMINSTCANPKQLWKSSMKSISWPSAAQLEELRTASEVCEETLPVKTDSETGEQTVDVA